MRRSSADLGHLAELKADVAVVGAGPIGIVTALELARRGVRVVLLESGFDKYDDATQRLSDADSAGEDYFHAKKEHAVRRQVGGTSSLWGGRCVPFDPIDFEARPAQPNSLWPVSYDEIRPYFDRASVWCVSGRPIFNARELPELADRDMIPGLPDGDVRTTDLERWSLPTRFGKEYRRALETEPNLDLVTGLTCTQIAMTPSGETVDHLVARNLNGLHATVRARQYVLATGGLEATRLLLASNDVHRDGIGNHSGHLGRWYMAHVEARVAQIHIAAPADRTIHDHELDQEGVYVRRRFTFSRELQAREPQPNAAVWFVNPEMGDHTHGSGILSGVYLTLISPLGKFLIAEAIRQVGTTTSKPTTVRAHLCNIVRDLIPAAKFAVTFTYERFLRPGRKAPGFFVRSASNTYPLQYHGEHLPHWESHVVLSDEADALGLPRLRTHMHYGEDDIRSVRQAMERIDAHLRKYGAGHVEFLYDDVEAEVKRYLAGHAGFHQTGTTRMSAHPDDGVVTRDLVVHGVDNLYVASTSVFPTSSQANPTFMGVAFAVRLADRLVHLIQQG